LISLVRCHCVPTCINFQVLLEISPAQQSDVKFICFVYGLSSVNQTKNITRIPDRCAPPKKSPMSPSLTMTSSLNFLSHNVSSQNVSTPNVSMPNVSWENSNSSMLMAATWYYLSTLLSNGTNPGKRKAQLSRDHSSVHRLVCNQPFRPTQPPTSWLSGATGRASDLRSTGRGFSSYSG